MYCRAEALLSLIHRAKAPLNDTARRMQRFGKSMQLQAFERIQHTAYQHYDRLFDQKPYIEASGARVGFHKKEVLVKKSPLLWKTLLKSIRKTDPNLLSRGQLRTEYLLRNRAQQSVQHFLKKYRLHIAEEEYFFLTHNKNHTQKAPKNAQKAFALHA